MSFSLSARHWQILFFGLAAAYMLYYAPFGINETDGGFLTGLAWQVLSGKTLYQDIIYVRPPLPVWFRAVELKILPEAWSVLGERWIFYLKLATYTYLGAAILARGKQKWMLAAVGFVVSAHCYPAMAWHTVDGIFWAVLSAWLLLKGSNIAVFGAGLALAGSLLCKQSFYPLLPIFALIALLDHQRPARTLTWLLSGFLTATILFSGYLYRAGLLGAYLQMTSGAASTAQALEHGILDYLRITPELALPGLLLLIPAFYWHRQQKNANKALILWALWICTLPLSYAAITLLRQDHTVPFAQSRAMFLVGVWFYSVYAWPAEGPFWQRLITVLRQQRAGWLCMAISWSAAVSWGYNLPILFATPWVWAAIQISTDLVAANPLKLKLSLFPLGYLALLLLAFRVGMAFVYRDGKRSDMQEPMGRIFPALQGIYSDVETANLYKDLSTLARRYPQFTVLPSFPQAHFLTRSYPPLPLDWVVNRETNGNNQSLETALAARHPVLFIQKSQWAKIQSDPELSFTRKCIENGRILEETAHFYILETKNDQ